LDPEGDSGPFLISIYPEPAICKQFIEALKAEGIRGEGDSHSCVTMEEWGLHWFFNNVSLVNKRSISSSGWPWTLSENAFAENYRYERDTLPNCNDLASRSGMLMVASSLTEEDINDIVSAFQKVASYIL
jgi:8-amino-3,8-dideoxy-alpha-D-manno-octulosonate transaminase